MCSDPKPRLVAWEWGDTRLHAGEVLESRYRALDLEPLASEDCYIAVLEFIHTVKEDQRLYYVIVENDHGSDRRALMLRVDEPAQVRNFCDIPQAFSSICPFIKLLGVKKTPALLSLGNDRKRAESRFMKNKRQLDA